MHYINRSVSQLIAALLFAATPCWRDLTRSKDLSTVAILGYQFGLYHVVVLLNFLCCNQPCFIVMFLFISDQTFYSSYLYRKYFRLRSALHLLLEKLVLTLERETSIVFYVFDTFRYAGSIPKWKFVIDDKISLLTDPKYMYCFNNNLFWN